MHLKFRHYPPRHTNPSLAFLFFLKQQIVKHPQMHLEFCHNPTTLNPRGQASLEAAIVRHLQMHLEGKVRRAGWFWCTGTSNHTEVHTHSFPPPLLLLLPMGWDGMECGTWQIREVDCPKVTRIGGAACGTRGGRNVAKIRACVEEWKHVQVELLALHSHRDIAELPGSPHSLQPCIEPAFLLRHLMPPALSHVWSCAFNAYSFLFLTITRRWWFDFSETDLTLTLRRRRPFE